jgi:hypothetical protein
MQKKVLTVRMGQNTLSKLANANAIAEGQRDARGRASLLLVHCGRMQLLGIDYEPQGSVGFHAHATPDPRSARRISVYPRT